MLAQTINSRTDSSNSCLPDLEIFEGNEIVSQTTSDTSKKFTNNVVPINKIAGLVSKTPATDGVTFADQLVANAFQQQFCNKLFDLIGGFVC